MPKLTPVLMYFTSLDVYNLGTRIKMSPGDSLVNLGRKILN